MYIWHGRQSYKGVEEQLNGFSLGGRADVLVREAAARVLRTAMQQGAAWQEYSVGRVVRGADGLTSLLRHLAPPLGLNALVIQSGQLDQLHCWLRGPC